RCDQDCRLPHRPGTGRRRGRRLCRGYGNTGRNHAGEAIEHRKKFEATSCAIEWEWEMNQALELKIMSLKDRITTDMTAAMKAKDAARTSTLRMLKAAIVNREKEKGEQLD